MLLKGSIGNVLFSESGCILVVLFIANESSNTEDVSSCNGENTEFTTKSIYSEVELPAIEGKRRQVPLDLLVRATLYNSKEVTDVLQKIMIKEISQTHL